VNGRTLQADDRIPAYFTMMNVLFTVVFFPVFQSGKRAYAENVKINFPSPLPLPSRCSTVLPLMIAPLELELPSFLVKIEYDYFHPQFLAATCVLMRVRKLGLRKIIPKSCPDPLAVFVGMLYIPSLFLQECQGGQRRRR